MQRRTFFTLTLLLAVAGAAAGLAARAPSPVVVTSIPWPSNGEGFGGWSGIDVSADGTAFWAVCDSGTITHGTLQRVAGQLAGVSAPRPNWIKGDGDHVVPFGTRDAEGISVQPDESLVVSFEGFARVQNHGGWQDRGERIDSPGIFADLAHNGSLEAVAVDNDGAILTLAEVPEGDGSTYPVFRHDDSGWSQPFALEHTSFWRAVGADFGPDGRFYLLERKFWGFGFSSRIRRFDLSTPMDVYPGEVVYVSPPLRHDNLEGIGLWRDTDGNIRAVMVSDDNYMPVQRTEIVEVILPE